MTSSLSFVSMALLLACVGHQLIPAEAQLSNLLGCPGKVGSALLGSCKTKLDERLELMDKAESDINQVAPSMFRCCYFAEYVHCVAEEAKPECGDSVSKAVEERVNKMFSVISGKCQEYTINSPKCIFVVWFNLIISFVLIGSIMMIGCCIGACLCKKKM